MTFEERKTKIYIFVFFLYSENGRFFFSGSNDLGPCGANDRGGETPGHRTYNLVTVDGTVVDNSKAEFTFKQQLKK